jgi:hypothetical protein
MAHRNGRPTLPFGDQWDLRTAGTSASAEETAAIVAALERFMQATARRSASASEAPDAWRQAAILEGVAREQEQDAPDPWINT